MGGPAADRLAAGGDGDRGHPADATELERSCYERFAGALMQDWWDQVRDANAG